MAKEKIKETEEREKKDIWSLRRCWLVMAGFEDRRYHKLQKAEGIYKLGMTPAWQSARNGDLSPTAAMNWILPTTWTII